MKAFRAAQGPNRNEINAVFGIPILHHTIPGLARRASPLWLRVTRLAGGNYVGVATLFQSDFTAGIHEVGGGYAVIEKFLQTFPSCLEVSYS
jgi:hypothetical protein